MGYAHDWLSIEGLQHNLEGQVHVVLAEREAVGAMIATTDDRRCQLTYFTTCCRFQKLFNAARQVAGCSEVFLNRLIIFHRKGVLKNPSSISSVLNTIERGNGL